MAKKSPLNLRAMCSAMDLDHPEDPLKLAREAVEENPLNQPSVPQGVVSPQFVALMTTKWWKSDKTQFTFAFQNGGTQSVAERIAKFAKVWNKVSALDFSWTQDVNAADFRIAFAADGYWSYLGTDCKSIPRNRPTMNLQGMNSASVSDKEMLRVVPHEFGHAVGMPHEHTRAAIVSRLDPAKTIRVFKRDQGWSEATTRAQVLTPISESALHGATEPDEKSIMCYWFTGECTKSGQPIVGGSDLSTLDKEFAAKIWPSGVIVPPPAAGNIVTAADGSKWVVTLVRAA